MNWYLYFVQYTIARGGGVFVFFIWFSSSTSLLGGGVPRGYRLIASHENNEEDKIIIKNFLSSLLFENYSKTITDGFKKNFLLTFLNTDKHVSSVLLRLTPSCFCLDCHS